MDRETLKQKLKALFERATQGTAAPDALAPEALSLFESFLEATQPKPTQKQPALMPAELWGNRPNKRGENPAAWIKRVYANELEAGTLTRAAILKADQPLYQAYATWIKRNPEDDLKLKTQIRTTYSSDDLKHAAMLLKPLSKEQRAYAALKNRESRQRRQRSRS